MTVQRSEAVLYLDWEEQLDLGGTRWGRDGRYVHFKSADDVEVY